jgi:DNA polymerase-3 subunit delta
MTFDHILKELKAGKFAPIYFLSGEEIYYIHKIADYIEQHALEPAQKDFNFNVFYGKDSDPNIIIGDAQQYPVFSEKKLIIVKEAQDIKKWDAFESYLKKPQASTILVICHNYKKIDKRTAFGKLIEKNSVFLETEKLKDEKLIHWVEALIDGHGFKIKPENSKLLVDHLGNDLSKIENEIEKLSLNINKGDLITTDLIEKYIGISKDYNMFEFTKAISFKDLTKALNILLYFQKNPKAGPPVVMMGLIYTLFSKLYILHNNLGLSDFDLAKKIGVPSFFFNEYKVAMRNFPLKKTEIAISLLYEYDGKLKGLNSGAEDDFELMKEMVFKLFN